MDEVKLYYESSYCAESSLYSFYGTTLRNRHTPHVSVRRVQQTLADAPNLRWARMLSAQILPLYITSSDTSGQ